MSTIEDDIVRLCNETADELGTTVAPIGNAILRGKVADWHRARLRELGEEIKNNRDTSLWVAEEYVTVKDIDAAVGRMCGKEQDTVQEGVHDKGGESETFGKEGE